MVFTYEYDTAYNGPALPIVEIAIRELGQSDNSVVVLQLGNFTIPKVYAVADRQNGEMILGRDVLNQFIVTLNGLANVVEIQQ